jgi:hypothetical protein
VETANMAMVVITSVFKIFEKTMAFMDFLYTIGHNIFGLSHGIQSNSCKWYTTEIPNPAPFLILLSLFS